MSEDEKKQKAYTLEVKRAILPELLWIEDVAISLGMELAEARHAIERGDFGPYNRIGKRIVIQRRSFLDALTENQINPSKDNLNRKPHLLNPERDELSD